MLTAQLAKYMDDEHLLASARAEIDPLTSTALELELLARFERLLDEFDLGELYRAADEYGLAAKDIKNLLKEIGEAGLDSPEALKAELDLARKFRALATDAGDFFTRLYDLVTTNQE